MRKIIVSEMVSIDGFFSGPAGEIDWHVVDEKFNGFAIDQLNAMDALLFGRVTYEGMASYWPTQPAIESDPEVADKMNTLPKYVFSKTLDKVAWGKWDNAILVKGDIGQEVSKLKQQPGKDMVIFGSGMIVSALAQLDLIDEYRMIVAPVALGHGISMFGGLENKVNLNLIDTKTLGSGNVVLYYQPDRKAL